MGSYTDLPRSHVVVLKNTGCVRRARGSSVLTAMRAGNSATGLGGGDGAGSNGAGSDGAGGDGAGSDGELAAMELVAMELAAMELAAMELAAMASWR